MKILLKNSLLALLLALMPISLAVAQDPAAEAVCTALDEGKSPGAIIEMLMAEPSGMSLEDATVVAMDACDDSSSEVFVSAGIAAADSLVEAESVASAVQAASDGDPQVGQVVEVAMAEYVKLMDQPYIHHDGDIPTGGGAYNPQGNSIDGLRPPIGPRPPVSPAS
ncbi:MAG: DUF732 domain-containing protein [Halioglobus sp.]